MRSFASILLPVVVLSACGGGSEPEAFDFTTIPDAPLSGTIGGDAWDFDVGVTDSFLSDAGGFFTTLSPVPTACDSFDDIGNHLITNLPTEAGEYEMGLSRSVTFYVAATQDNLVALKGGIIIDEVTETELSGAMLAEFDDGNEVGGSFVVEICPESTF